MRKKLTDEALIEMLLVHGGVKGAAVATGLSERAIYQRLQNPAVRAKYDEMRSLSLEGATMALSGSLVDAVNLLHDVVTDEHAQTSLRIQSADALLRHSLRYAEFTSLQKRIEQLEKALQEKGVE